MIDRTCEFCHCGLDESDKFCTRCGAAAPFMPPMQKIQPLYRGMPCSGSTAQASFSGSVALSFYGTMDDYFAKFYK